MKRIVTVQDLINELMLVVNKKAEINVTVAGDGYETEYTPCLYDFSIIDFTDVHPDDGEAENPMEWLPCPRCGLRPLVWEFDNGRATACGCGTDCYSHWSVQAESIMSVIKRSDNGKSAEAYDIDELKNNWNHWVRTGEILFTPGNGRW